MTPRERATIFLRKWSGRVVSAPTYGEMKADLEAAIIADRRELLAEDDESLAAICKWIAGLTAPRDPELCRPRARHILNELRRHVGVE